MLARQIRVSIATCLLTFALGGGGANATSLARDGYIGTISKSDARKRGDNITFANLRSNSPVVIFPSGNAEELNRVFEDDEIIVLFFLGTVTGSTETFYLNKKHNRFTLIEVGALEARVTGADIRPEVTFGILK